jgi:hypothetical protein
MIPCQLNSLCDRKLEDYYEWLTKNVEDNDCSLLIFRSEKIFNWIFSRNVINIIYFRGLFNDAFSANTLLLRFRQFAFHSLQRWGLPEVQGCQINVQSYLPIEVATSNLSASVPPLELNMTLLVSKSPSHSLYVPSGVTQNALILFIRLRIKY